MRYKPGDGFRRFCYSLLSVCYLIFYFFFDRYALVKIGNKTGQVGKIISVDVLEDSSARQLGRTDYFIVQFFGHAHEKLHFRFDEIQILTWAEVKSYWILDS